MAAVVATMVVGPVVKLVMEKVSSSLLDQYKVMKGMEEQHDILKRKLLAILDIITDAEQAIARRAGVMAWLEDIKKVARKAEKIFDEFNYEALRRKAKKEGNYKELGFCVVMLFPVHNRFIFRNRMGRKLRKVVHEIEVLVIEMNAFGFKQQPLSSTQLRQKNHDMFDLEKIPSRSRAEDNKKIVDIVIGQANNANLTVVPIVGMGGLGKTTLAQLVYNEPDIQKHFDLLLWVCVSDGFDVDSLAQSIVEAAPYEKRDITKEVVCSKKKNTPLDILRNVVKGERYLLVLDDVWPQEDRAREDRKWKQLKGHLEHGGMGSVVLTTTRDKRVSEIMGTVEAYNLEALGIQYIKEIIETTAFSRFKKEEDRPAVLVNMVGEIVKRCVGSPLAAIALGSILYDKTSVEEWKAVSRRSNICTEGSSILPILKLSYDNLPSHMKQCFSFCAIFPKDYEIDVDKLIQLWIAHGFIIQEEHVRLETSGKHIFNELASRLFFQDVKHVQGTVREIERSGVCYSRTTCRIHDLMHDVALSVTGKDCAIATEEPGCAVKTEEQSQSDWLPHTTRHVFLSCKEPGKKLNSSLENSSPTIQTIMCDSFMEISLQHVPKYSSLQALQLRVNRSSFPLEPKHLHHLKYLDLSRSRIEALPEDMSILYSLQTLNLSGCIYLGGLPRKMKYMTALRHLYTHGCPELKSMPQDLGKLTSLQTLTCFVAGSGSDCSTVRELGHLNLGGQLELNHLDNVTEEDAEAANLVAKQEIRELTLKWSGRHAFMSSNENDARVMKKLVPHDGLHALRIQSYGATTFPTELAMLPNIVEIHLFNCSQLKWLFSRHSGTSFAFPNLKELTLEDLAYLERWWDTDDDMVQGDEIMFPLLQKLYISRCEQLKALPGHPTFPNLRNATLDRCRELTTTAKSQKLSVLNVDGREDKLLLWLDRHKTSLTNVELNNIQGSVRSDVFMMETTLAKHTLRELLDEKDKWNYHDFPLSVLVLRYLNTDIIEFCACFVHLQDFTIIGCGRVYWPEKEFEGLVSLRRLWIQRWNKLIGYAPAPAEPSTSSQTRKLLPCLESLTIKICDRLVDVFDIPTSLRRMEISDCRKLESTYGRRQQQGQTASSIHQGSSSILEVASSSPLLAGAEHLEEFKIEECQSLTGVLHLPPSLKALNIAYCSLLTSLESRSGELPSLESLRLFKCDVLSSLPDGPQAYSSVQHLVIGECPSMKMLPTSLQQRLGSLQEENIDAHYYGGTTRSMPSAEITEI